MEDIPGSTAPSWLARLQVRDRDAWLRLSKLYGPLVYCWCRQQRVVKEDAEDVVQQVFGRVLGHVHRFEKIPGHSFRGWLWTITRNQILDYFRSEGRRLHAVGGSAAHERLQEIPEDLDDCEPARNAATTIVHRALAAIESRFEHSTWQAFWSVAIDGRAPKDVADNLGMSVNAVWIAKSRVLERLREELGED